MAVVTVYAASHPGDPTALGRSTVDAEKGEGKVRSIGAKFTITNGNSINSLFYLGRVPSNARILPSSTLYHAAISGLSDMDIGLYTANGGALLDIDALADGLDMTSGTTKAVMAAVTVTNYDMKAWQLAGLSADPGGMLDIVATLKAAATATVVCFASILWAEAR